MNMTEAAVTLDVCERENLLGSTEHPPLFIVKLKYRSGWQKSRSSRSTW